MLFPQLTRSRFLAKLGLLLALCSLFLLSACWVISINGLDEGDLDHVDKDGIYDAGLEGSWITNDLTCAIILNVKSERHQYRWEKTAFGEHCEDSGKTFYSNADLYQLGNNHFLDVSARASDICKMCIGIHWIFLVQNSGDTLYLMPIDSDWLKNALETKAVTLATLAGDPETLTASPADLKAFCRKYADDRRVFGRVGKLTFKRKYADRP
jgi:hypothetical protein